MNSSKMEITFLMLGEAVVDLISTGIVTSLEDANSFQRFPGGEVSNLAMNLSRLGYPTAIGACVGSDGFGRYLKNQLRQAGVSLKYIQTYPKAPTTLISVTRHTTTPDFTIYRGADGYLKITDELMDAAQNCQVVHTSAGSLANNPSRSTIQKLLEIAHQQGKMISLDPNYHPKIWPDRSDFLSYLKDLFAIITITKPSLDDSKRIFGSDRTPRDYLDAYLELGPDLVYLTMGRDGVLIGTSEGDYFQLEANPISVVDVTGAGDAFWSGTLAGLLSGASALDAARLGQVIAEYKIGRVGPILDYPDMTVFQNQAKSIMVSSLV